MNKNKTILIIGAKSDIALSVANRFASGGYNIQLAARNHSELDAVANDLKIRYEINAFTYEIDILRCDTFQSFIENLNCLPDIVLCAVGILGNQKDDESNYTDSSLVIRTNYEGPSLLLGEIANHFEKRKYGSIIGISSVAGDRGRASNYIYGSAKSGFTSFLSGLRNRLYATNINVLTLVPGFVATKMTKELNLPKLLTSNPEDISEIIFNNINKSKVLYVFPWRLIMLVISCIPEFLFKKLKL